MLNELQFNSISEIKEAYQIQWKLEKQAKQQAKQQAIPAPLPEVKIDYDQIAECEYYAALNAGYSERKARAIFRKIKRNR